MLVLHNYASCLEECTSLRWKEGRTEAGHETRCLDEVKKVCSALLLKLKDAKMTCMKREQ